MAVATISRRRHMLPRPAVHQGGLALLDGERRRRAGCARLVAGRDGEQRPGRKGFRRGAAGSGWPAAGGGGRSAHASCRPAAWSDGHGPETRRGAPPSSRPRVPGRHGREQQHRAGRGRRAPATHASSPAEATSSGASLQPGCGRRAAACEPRLPPRRPWARSGDRTRHLVAWPPRIACSGKNRDGACVRDICCFDVLGWSTRKMALLVVLAMEKSEGVRASGLCYCSYLAS